MDSFKDCRCGVRIPAEWRTCASCLTNSAVLGDWEFEKRRRRLEVNRRMKRASEMDAIINSEANQARSVLLARQKYVRKTATGATKALQDWYNKR